MVPGVGLGLGLCMETDTQTDRHTTENITFSQLRWRAVMKVTRKGRTINVNQWFTLQYQRLGISSQLVHLFVLYCMPNFN